MQSEDQGAELEAGEVAGVCLPSLAARLAELEPLLEGAAEICGRVRLDRSRADLLVVVRVLVEVRDALEALAVEP